MTVVSLSCHLSPLFIFLSPFMPSHLSTKHHHYRPLTNFHSHHTFPAKSLHLSRCSLTFLLMPPTITPLPSPPSLTLLSPLLPQDPKERLGCHPQTGFADIMGHPFFRNVDWDLVSHSLFTLSALSSPFSVLLSSPRSSTSS